MVSSQLDSDLTATVKTNVGQSNAAQVFYCSCCVYYLLNSMLKPFGYSVSNFRILKLYLSISRWARVSLDLEVFVS